MAIPTIQDYFGSNADVSNGVLTINAADLGLTALQLEDPDKVLAAIIKMTRNFTAIDTAEESGIEVGAPRKLFATRNNQNLIGIDYPVTIYLPDPTSVEFNPADVI